MSGWVALPCFLCPEFLGNLIQTATLLTVERGNAVYIEKQDKDHRLDVTTDLEADQQLTP